MWGKKRQGCLMGNYWFYWYWVQDPLPFDKEGAFMRSIWHKATVVNKWRARIPMASISKQYVFGIANTSESVNHKFGIALKHKDHCNVLPSSCTSFLELEHAIMIAFIGIKPSLRNKSIRRSPSMLIQHLLHGVILWTIWTKRNDRVFNQAQWLESKAKHLIWVDLVMYAMVPWERVVEFVKINAYMAKTLLKGVLRWEHL